MTSIDLGRPVQGDVVDLILDDHRTFETLLRELRNEGADREGVRQQLSELLVAHGEAEEANRCAGAAEVPADEEVLAILEPLRELDEDAYKRYASVYRSIESLADFEAVITSLRASNSSSHTARNLQTT